MLQTTGLRETATVVDDPSQSEPEHGGVGTSTRSLAWTRAGAVLLVASALLWAPLPIVPFLPLSAGAKVAVGTGLVVVAEIAFWAGTALAGPEALRRIRSWIRDRGRRP